MCNHEDKISLSGRVVIAMRPWVTKVLDTSLKAEGIRQMEVKVIVPTPHELVYEQSSPQIVAEGKVVLNLLVDMNYWCFIIPTAEWRIPIGFDFEIEPSSRAFVELTSSGSTGSVSALPT